MTSRSIPLLFAALTVTPLVLLAAWSLQIAGDAITEQSRAKTEASAEGGAAFVRARLQGLSETVEAYANRPLVRAALADGRVTPAERRLLTTTVDELQRMRSGLGTAFVAHADGTLIDIAPRTPSIVGRNFAYRDWYRGVTRTGTTYVSEAYTSLAAGRPRVVGVASPIRPPGDASAEPVGILVVAYDVSTLKRYARDFARAQDVRLTITDQRGAIVADPSPGAAPGEAVLRDDGVTDALAGRASTRARGRGDERTLVAYQPIDGSGWTVSAEVSMRESSAPVRRVQTAIIAATLLLIVLLALAVRYLLRRLERQQATLRQQIDALEAKNRTLDTFSHTLAHDLRTPLATITGYANLLQDTLAEPPPPATRMLSSIEHTSRRMDTLIGDVLALATASRRSSREWVELPRLIEEIAADVPDIDLEVGELPPRIFASGSDLYRGIKNLVENAARYARVDGATPWARISGEQRPSVWQLHVDDAGPGVPVAEREAIFRSFQRGQHGPDAPSGTGLGLAIVSAFAEAHGGGVTVSASPEGGARFTITLQRPDPAAMPPEHAEHAGDAAAVSRR